MSQDNMTVANGDGATVRAKINTGLQALASTSKGTSRPSTAYAGQLWLDDNSPSSTVWSLYLFDGTDDILVGLFDSTDNRFVSAETQAANVASASTIDLDAATGQLVDVTGTTGVSAVTLAQGRRKVVRFTDALALTHGASLVLPGGANIVTAAGDFATFHGYSGGVVRCSSFMRASGSPVGGASFFVGSTTRDLTTASGTQAVVGVDFKPKAVILFAGVNGGARMSCGFSDGVTHRSIYDNNGASAGSYGSASGASVIMATDGSNIQTATVTAFGDDGFTLNWTKVGSPTGTATINYLCLR